MTRPITNPALWTVTVHYRGEEPQTHVFTRPHEVQELMDAILHSEGFVAVQSLRIERTVRGSIDLTPWEGNLHGV